MPIRKDYYLGEDIKVMLNAVTEGYSIKEDNDLEAVVFNTSIKDAKKVFTKSDMRELQDGEYAYTFIVHSNELGAGEYYLEVIANVPDTDFGYTRKSIDRRYLCPVKP